MILNESYTLSNGIQIPKLGLRKTALRTLENTQSASLFVVPFFWFTQTA